MAKFKSVTTSNTSTSIADTIITPKGQVDIVFIVDTTGSMGGIINNVQNNLKAFVDDIKSAGITPSFALVEYRDITCDGTNSTNTKKNSDNENWFRNADEFKKAIANLGVAGGGDGPETAIDGLEMAHRLDMRDSAQKFFILVTDADCKTENNYGINSMDDLIQSLKNDNINVSVVSTSDYSSYYSKLYGTTGGVFANINGNFKNELLTISDKINATTNDGYWVFLKGLTLKYAKLDTKPSALSSADTDKDTLLDNRELKSLEPTITINFSDYFRLMYGNPAGIIFNYPNAKAYEYYSDPTFEDTDYDGIDDNIDNQKLDNSFSGTLEMEYDDTIESDVDYSFDLRSFFREQSKYNVQLSKISVLLSGTIYYGDYLFLNDGLPRSAYNLLKYHGFEDLKIYKIADGSDEFSIPSYSDNHLSEICIGHQKVKYNGKEKDVVAIVVRGTNGTIEEWTSNFDIGSTDELNAWKNWDLSGGTNSSSFDYTLNYFLNHDIDELNAFADWKNQDNHKGFDIATNRILKFVNAYVNKYVDKSIVTYWVTGHSRGAGIANLLSAYLIDNKNTVFAYTFAAPNTTTSDNYENEKYNSIFNIINQDDFVPRLPMDEWHFNKYGCTKTPISIADDYEKEWENLTCIFDYDPDTIGLEKTITKIAEVGKDSHDIYDRNNCYIFTCDCHGDGSFDDETTITNYGISKKSREEAKSKIPDNALPYCIIEDTGIIRYNFTVCQTPEYFMQILAAQMAGELTTGNGKGLLDENFTFLCSLNIADRYESAKKAIVKSSIGGLKHPHYVESYYVLAKHTK